MGNRETEMSGGKQTEWEPTEGEMQEYLAEMMAELNFRLLFAQRSGRILWIEDITLTSYEGRKTEKQKECFSGEEKERKVNNLWQ